jgi:hypothetical protein
MRPGAISFGAQPSVRRLRKLACVKQRVIAKAERRPAKLDLGDYPYLPPANVKTPRLPIIWLWFSGPQHDGLGSCRQPCAAASFARASPATAQTASLPARA